MEKMKDALRKTQIGLLVRSLLEDIQHWTPSKNPDSVEVDGVIYEYDSSNLRIRMKRRKHFQLVKRRATATLSDLTTEIHGDFFLKPSNTSASSSSGLTREFEGCLVQVEEFTVLIGFCDLNPPIRLSIEKYKIITGILGKTKLGNPIPVEHDPHVQSYFHNFKRNLPSENVITDAEELSILSQVSNSFRRRESFDNTEIKQEESEGSEEEESNNTQSFLSTQIPMAHLAPVVRNNGLTRNPAAGLQMLMQQQQEKQLASKRAAISEPVLSPNTLVSNQRLTPASEHTSDAPINAQKSMTPASNASGTGVPVVIHTTPKGKNQNGKRGSPSEDDVAQAARKRVREEHLSTHGDQSATLNAAQGNAPAEGIVAQKTSRQLRWRDMIIPKDQEKLLESDDALDPPKPGNPRPTCRLPIELWKQFHIVMERRAGLCSKSVSKDAIEQDEEQGSGPQGDSESSDPDSISSAVNTNAPIFTQTEPEFRKFAFEPKHSMNDSDSDSDASEPIPWDISPSQRPRKPEMPPDSSLEQPSPKRSVNHHHPSPSGRAKIQREVVSPGQIDPVKSTQKPIIFDLESEDSDMELAVPLALDRLSQTDQLEVESLRISNPPSSVVEDAAIMVNRSPSGGAQEARLANTPSSYSHSRQISASLDTHDLVDRAISAESSSLDDNHDDTADLYPPTSPTLEMLRHKLTPLTRDKVADNSRLLTRMPSAARPIVIQSEDKDQDMHMDVGEESEEEESVIPPRPLRRKVSASLSIVTQDSEYNYRRMCDEVKETQSKATQQQYESDGDEDRPEYGDVESEHGILEPRRRDDIFESHDDVSKHHKSATDIDNESSSIAASETRSEDLYDAEPGDRDPISPSVGEHDTEEASTLGLEDHPLSDEVEEMVHQQLQSDIATYSQCSITSPARGATSNATSPSVRSRNLSEVQVQASSPAPAPSSPHNVFVYSKGKGKSNEVFEEEDAASTPSMSKRRKNDGDAPRILERQTNHTSLDFEQAGMQHRQDFMDQREASHRSPASRASSEVHRPATPKADLRHQSDLGDLSLLAAAAINNMGLGRPREAQNESFLEIVYRRFVNAYHDHYDGEEKHLLGACKLIQKLDSSGSHAPHQSMWDDFIIRNRVEYRRYLSDCSDAAEFPMRYEIFYYEMIQEPLHTKRIITPKILAELLSIEGLSTPSTPKSSRRAASRQRPSLLQQYSSSSRRSSLANVISRRPSGEASINHPSPLIQHLDIRPKSPEASRAETNNDVKVAPDDPITQNLDRSVDEWLQKSQTSAPSVTLTAENGPGGPYPALSSLSATDGVSNASISPPPRRISTRRSLPWKARPKSPSAHIPSASVPSIISSISAQRIRVTEPEVETRIEQPKVKSPNASSVNPTRRSLPWRTSPKPPSARAPGASIPSIASSISAKRKRTKESEVVVQIEEPKDKSPKPLSTPNQSTSNSAKRKRTTKPEVAVQTEKPKSSPPKPSIVKTESGEKQEAPWYLHPNTKYNEFSSSYMSLKSEKHRPQPTLLKVMNERAKQKDKRLMVGGINIFSWME